MALRIGFAFNEKPSEEEEPPSSVSHDRFAEWDDPETIAVVAEALGRAGTVIRLEADESFPQRLRETRPDIVFNIAEGLYGPSREAQVPAICEFYDIPYTGSDPLTLALGLDKERTKEVLRARGVPTPRWTVAGNGSGTLQPDGLTHPLFVKPLFEGSPTLCTKKLRPADAPLRCGAHSSEWRETLLPMVWRRYSRQLRNPMGKTLLMFL